MGRVDAAEWREGIGLHHSLWLQCHPCNEFEKCKWLSRVKVDIVPCDKFSAEVRDNLDANYKQALCHSSIPFTSLITWFSPASIREWVRTRKTDRQKISKRQKHWRQLERLTLFRQRRLSNIVNTHMFTRPHTSSQPHTKVHKPWLWCGKWARNTIPCTRTSGLISIPRSVSLLMSSLTAN